VVGQQSPMAKKNKRSKSKNGREWRDNLKTGCQIQLSGYFCSLVCLANQPSPRVTLSPTIRGGTLRENGCERANVFHYTVRKMAKYIEYE